jgi:hypothetical protein
MVYTFHCGETVALVDDHPLLDLKAGDTGLVIVLYAMEPPAYEVTFCDLDGKEFDCLMYEEELAKITVSPDALNSILNSSAGPTA